MKAQWQDIQTRLQQQLQDNPLLQQWQRWYGALPARDRLIVQGVGWLMLVALIVVLVYAPLLEGRRNASAQLERNLTTYNLIASNAGRFGNAQAGGSNGSAPLLSVVTQQAKVQGISLSRYEQDGQSLRVWLDKAAFDEAISWLEALQGAHGIQASQISIDQAGQPGRVDIRATLTR